MVMRGRVAVLVVTLGALVAGCTGEAAPAETVGVETSAASKNPTPTPTPVAVPTPQAPAQPGSPSPESARDNATYFLQLYPFVYLTGDLAEWDRLSAPSCAYCVKTRDDVSRIAVAGHQVTGGSLQVTETRVDEVEPGALFSVFIHYVEAPSQEVNGSGAPVAASDGGTYTALVAIRWVDGKWSVEAVDINAAQ